MTASGPMVRLERLRRSFRGPGGKAIPVVAIDELRVEHGAGLLLLGPNGTGKTTLLHLVAGLLRPDAGRIEIDGRDIVALSESRRDRWRGATVGYLLQGSTLLEGLTAEENVMAAMLLRGVPVRQQRSRARLLLERFDVAQRARHRPAAMSGGERQRVALARAVANDPPLVLADEPTASLDEASAASLVAHLAELRGEGRTIVVATHHPGLFDSTFGKLELGSSVRGHGEAQRPSSEEAT